MDSNVSTWLGREPIEIDVPDLSAKRILITGANGYIGTRLTEFAVSKGAVTFPCDITDGNVLDVEALSEVFREALPTTVIHLAAHKYATIAEEIPEDVAQLNITGTANVVNLAEYYGAKIVLASTCKAADPCTAYGASKLIAERVALNYKASTVFRLVNVLGSTGSVIDIWDAIPAGLALPVANALRYWISGEEAVKYLLACITLQQGVFAPSIDILRLQSVWEIAKRYDPLRRRVYMPLRRGDRINERVIAEYENIHTPHFNGMMKISEPWTR